jgi:predicted transcriptional regulator
MSMNEKEIQMLNATFRIVSAYVATHKIPEDQLPGLISAVYSDLYGLEVEPIKPVDPGKQLLRPFVSANKSVKPDHLVCLEDGKQFKLLKRHLRIDHSMTPEQYRQRWGLSATYPMIAPNFRLARSKMALNFGLGRGSKKSGN